MISTKSLTPLSPSVSYCETIRDVYREVLDDHHKAKTEWRIIGDRIDELSAQILSTQDASQRQRLEEEQVAALKDVRRIESELISNRARIKEIQNDYVISGCSSISGPLPAPPL